MQLDYTYCIDENCNKRFECKRNLEFYSQEEIKELYTKNRFVNEINSTYCLVLGNYTLFEKGD